MILPIYTYNIKDINRLSKDFTDKYDDDIYGLIIKLTNEESLVGYSCKQYKLVQYDLALILAYTIMVDHATTKQSWSTYVTKYDLENRRKALACSNINLDELLIMFGLPPVTVDDCDYGIEEMSIEGECNVCAFIIEPELTCSEDEEDVSVDALIILDSYEDGSICEYYTDNCN